MAFTLGEDCFRFNTQPLIGTVRGLRTRYHQVNKCPHPSRPRLTVPFTSFIHPRRFCFRDPTQPHPQTYIQAQLKALEARCRQLLEQDGHLPCQVQSDREYRTLVLPYALDRPSEGGAEALLGGMMGGMDDAFLLADDPVVGSPALSNSRGPRRGGGGVGGGAGGGGVGGTRYPKTFPFSAVVPKLSSELHRVVVLCLLFGLQLQLPAMEATLLQVGGGLSKEGARARFLSQVGCIHTPCHPSTHACAHIYTHIYRWWRTASRCSTGC